MTRNTLYIYIYSYDEIRNTFMYFLNNKLSIRTRKNIIGLGSLAISS